MKNLDLKLWRYTRYFFISNTFINQAKATQHPEAELLLFLYYKMYKKQVLLFKWGHMINDNENEAENEP